MSSTRWSSASREAKAGTGRWCSSPVTPASASRAWSTSCAASLPSPVRTRPGWKGCCVSFGQTIPLLPVIDQLREQLRHRGVGRRGGHHRQARRRHRAARRARRPRSLSPLPAGGRSGRSGHCRCMDAAAAPGAHLRRAAGARAAGRAAAPDGVGVRGPALDRQQHGGVPGHDAWTPWRARPCC